MKSAAPSKSKLHRPRSDDAGSKARAVEAAIKLLLNGLPVADRQQVLANLRDAMAPASAKAGPVLVEVANTVERVRQAQGRECDPKVTVAEIKEGVHAAGIEAEPKEVYNAISYLARRGRLRQVGYSQYQIVGGPGFVSPTSFGLEPKDDGE